MKYAFQLVLLVSFVSFLNLAGLVVIIGFFGGAAGAGPVPVGNGDVNGDGSIDIADVIYLATHLFQDGPAPVALALDPPEAMQSWPPSPESIVNLNSANLPGAGETGTISVPAGGEVVIFEIPDDAWLVVTDIQSAATNGGLNWHFHLLEVASAGEVVVKVGRQYFDMEYGAGGEKPAYRSAVGLTFRPGSSMVLRNHNTQQEHATFTLTGYLVPKVD